MLTQGKIKRRQGFGAFDEGAKAALGADFQRQDRRMLDNPVTGRS